MSSLPLAVERAASRGDLAEFRTLLGDPEGFPDVVLGRTFMAIGDRPLDVAIRLAPIAMIDELLRMGANADAPAQDGFPALFMAIDAPRNDRHEVLTLLLAYGADPHRRGINGGTALHLAVWRRDVDAVRILLGAGADPDVPADVDDRTTAREDAAAAGFDAAIALMDAERPR